MLPAFLRRERSAPAPAGAAPGQDPLVRAAIKQSEDCFWGEWSRSSDLRAAAEKAVRENQEQPAPAGVRAAVMEYVKSRANLKQCMAELRGVSHQAPTSAEDQKAIDSALQSMRAIYLGQTRFELAVLIGLIDKAAGERELSSPEPGSQ